MITLLPEGAYTAHGAKSNFFPVLANSSLSLEIQHWILASINGSILLMFVKLYFGRTVSPHCHSTEKRAYGSCHDLSMMSMLLVFLHIEHALYLPKTAGDVMLRLIDIAMIDCRQKCCITDYK